MAKVLLLDIETAPILGYAWSLWNQNIGINQIHKDWFILSWAAKWLDEKQVFYEDLRGIKDPAKTQDKKILKSLWKLINGADVVLTQNGKRFDIKKINARFLINGMQPPSSFRQIDTLEIAKKHFGFTSNKLAYMAEILGSKQKKSEHKEFPGFDLWKECLKGNQKAWREMERYNKQDVAVLEEVYHKLRPFSKNLNFDVYDEALTNSCGCNSSSFMRNGFAYTDNKKMQRYRCKNCGNEVLGKENLLSSEKRKSLLKSSPR